MCRLTLKKNFLSAVAKFALCFFSYIVLVCLLRLLSTEALSFKQDWGYVASFAFLFSAVSCLTSFSKSGFLFSFALVFLYVGAACVKIFSSIILSEREIVHTLCFATFLSSFLLTAQYLILLLKNNFARRFLKTLTGALSVLAIIPPLTVIGYFFAQKALFSADILLTLFQTNLSETLAYLGEQNLFVWGALSLLLLAIFVLFVRFFENLIFPKGFKKAACILVAVLLAYTGLNILPKLNLHLTANIYMNTVETLKNFKQYEQNKALRLQKVEKLKTLNLSSVQSGIYILVIGESETRDHMGAYGYQRNTTPWLSSLKENDDTIIFSNAYSNHTHTVPTLTYALTSTNQYNPTPLLEADSILEVAKAAGFETYWISNQPKDSVFLTPLSVMASTADNQIWLNTNIGDKLSTEYYDEHISDEILQQKFNPKSFVVIHLMGSHAAYRDRYPADFNRFKGSSKKNIDFYDNSVLYTDFVLRRIYEATRLNPAFKALVYLSDHGDDVDNHLGHESSRFTYAMARIPFFMIVSQSFLDTQSETFNAFKQNKDKLWTNDLLYDFMLKTMGIKELEKPAYDISSANYEIKEENALVLHGTKKFSDR